MVARNAMHQPAIQAALNNLVEVIRTALMAEFLEYSRGGDGAPGSAKRKAKPRNGVKKASPKKASPKKASPKRRR